MHSQALQELFANASKALVLYARQWCSTPEDAVQEAFIDLSNCTTDPISPKAWLYTTTRRKAQNITRSETRRRNQLERIFQGKESEQASEYWIEPNTANGIDAAEVLDGLNALAPEPREMIIARVWGELSFEELGQLMNCSASSAHRRYVSALSELRDSVLGKPTPQKNASSLKSIAVPTHRDV
jgi:RNA polymerase sigma factor (sigma-70 family)